MALASLAAKKMSTIGALNQGISALCDIFITGGLCYALHTGRTGMKRYVATTRARAPTRLIDSRRRTGNIVDRFMTYAMNCVGLAT